MPRLLKNQLKDLQGKYDSLCEKHQVTRGKLKALKREANLVSSTRPDITVTTIIPGETVSLRAQGTFDSRMKIPGVTDAYRKEVLNGLCMDILRKIEKKGLMSIWEEEEMYTGRTKISALIQIVKNK